MRIVPAAAAKVGCMNTASKSIVETASRIDVSFLIFSHSPYSLFSSFANPVFIYIWNILMENIDRNFIFKLCRQTHSAW